MLYLIRPVRQMVVARFEFKPEEAANFIDSPESGQTVIEQVFDSIEELIETTQEFEHALVDCTTVVNGKMLCLSSFKTK